ncbi:MULTISPECIES: YqzH family protein [unclassified Bacillus (in: firmicutes)]|uniref:YqzH family protein n=1 Tax=unclassified Bacillus (in: firmicutes) TaxID=185979 RepID=UPI0008E7F183|nr:MULTISPECIES: YqzH family protein [unclassified Bacillus (in: firmicutes)]SFA97430.1 YqzH-like protein [Bacillus sp. UNCCL13]SFQ80486.1 YqzH-like protein [Bacillus sp. cl95]
MDKKFIYKMIENIFKQYYQHGENLPLNKSDYDRLYEEILTVKATETDADLYDIINDVVYEFLSGA